MKRLFLLSALALFLCSAHSWAYSFKEGDIYYNITSEEDADVKTVEVTWGGSNAKSGTDAYTGTVTIPETVEHEETEYTVTGVGYCAFYGCTGLTSIVIGDNVTYIGEQAFDGCTNLAGELKIPDSVTEIVAYAFDGCSSLTSLTLGENVASIGNYAFYNCSGLTGELKIPDSVTELGERAFTGCAGLTSLIIGNGVTTIGQYTFDACSGLESIVIGENVTSIDQYAFRNCTSLTSLTLGESVTTIGQYAFYKCSSLEELIIPDSVTKIGNHAFDGCSSITSLTIGSGVTSIGDQAFAGCKSLTELTIPDNVTTIKSWAFSGCSGLTSITFGSGLETIEGSAFNACGTITSITFTSTTPPDCTSAAFSNTTLKNCTVYVPVGSEEAYAESEYWGTFTIVEYNEDKTLYYDPTVVTSEEVASITYSSATMEGTVTKGTRDIEELGFEYWVTDEEVKTYKVETTITGTDAVTITAELTDLKEATTFSYRAYATTEVTKSGTEETFIRTTYGDTKTFTIPTRPTVQTSAATIETYNSATLNGSVSGGSETTENTYGFEYWIGDGEKTPIEVEGDEMTATISGLADGTEYSYRAYATTEYGTTYGETLSFTTPTRPTVTTTNATDVTYESATLNGSVSGGTESIEITAKGFEYWTAEDESEKMTVEGTEDGDEGNMSATIEELAENATYNYCAYATTEYGTTYGEPLIFTTLNATLLNSLVTAITEVQTELTSAWEAIQTDYPDVVEKLTTDYEAIAAELETLLETTKEAYSDGTLNEDTAAEVEASLEEIAESIEKLTTDAKTAENLYLYDAITEKIEAVLTELNTTWSTIQKNYPDAVSSLKSTYNSLSSELSTMLGDMKKNKDSMTQDLVSETESSLASIEKKIEKMLADAAVKENDYLYTTVVAEIEAVEEELTTAWSTIQSDCADVADDFEDEYEALKEELDSLLKELEEAYSNGTITEEMAEDIRQKLEEITEAMDSLLSEAKEAEDEYLYNTLYEDAVSEVEATEESLASAWTTITGKYPDMVADLQATRDGIAAEIEAVRTELDETYEAGELTEDTVAEMEEELSAIEKEIEDMLSNASIATGIDGMAADSDVRVYNLSGSRVHRLERGNVYIYHYSDGTSKKVLVK